MSAAGLNEQNPSPMEPNGGRECDGSKAPGVRNTFVVFLRFFHLALLFWNQTCGNIRQQEKNTKILNFSDFIIMINRTVTRISDDINDSDKYLTIKCTTIYRSNYPGSEGKQASNFY